MMKSAILASCLAAATAFAPAQTGKASTALNGAFDGEIGAASAGEFVDRAERMWRIGIGGEASGRTRWPRRSQEAFCWKRTIAA